MKKLIFAVLFLSTASYALVSGWNPLSAFRANSSVTVGNATPSGFSLNQVLTNYTATDPAIPTGALEAIKDETHLTFNTPPDPFFDLSGFSTSVTLDGSAVMNMGFAAANMSPNYNGTGSIINFFGLASQPTVNSGAVTGKSAAIYGLMSYFGGNVANSYSLYGDSPIVSGSPTITNNYGLFLEDETGIGTNNWNIWSNGTGSDNHFEGKITTLGGISNAVSQTTLTGSAGTAVCSEPEKGASYKKVLCFLNGYTDTSTQTFTYPVTFAQTPYVYGVSAGVSGATATASSIKFTTVTVTGFVFAEGF